VSVCGFECALIGTSVILLNYHVQELSMATATDELVSHRSDIKYYNCPKDCAQLHEYTYMHGHPTRLLSNIIVVLNMLQISS